MIKPYLWKVLKNKGDLKYREASTKDIAMKLYETQMTDAQKKVFDKANQSLNKAGWIDLMGAEDAPKKVKYNTVNIARRNMRKGRLTFLKFVMKPFFLDNDAMRSVIKKVIDADEITDEHKKEFNDAIKEIYASGATLE